MTFEEGGPLFFRGSGIRGKGRAELLADADSDVFVRGTAGEGDDFGGFDWFWGGFEGNGLQELGKAGEEAGDEHALSFATAHRFGELEDAATGSAGEAVEGLHDELLHAGGENVGVEEFCGLLFVKLTECGEVDDEILGAVEDGLSRGAAGEGLHRVGAKRVLGQAVRAVRSCWGVAARIARQSRCRSAGVFWVEWEDIPEAGRRCKGGFSFARCMGHGMGGAARKGGDFWDRRPTFLHKVCSRRSPPGPFPAWESCSGDCRGRGCLRQQK